MIAVATTDDWGAPEITLDDGGGPQTWIGSGPDAAAAAVDFASWLSGAFGGSGVWTVSAATLGGLDAAFDVGASVTGSSNAAAQTMLGTAATIGATTTIAWVNIAGTIGASMVGAAPVSDRNHARTLGRGVAGGAGVARDVSARSFAPRVQWAASTVQATRVGDVLAGAASPRTASIYTESAGWFTDASLGKIALTPRGPGLWLCEAEVRHGG